MLMKVFRLSLAFSLLLLAFSVPAARAQAPAAAFAIVDNTTGTVLESSAGQKKLQIGSLTKIATAMVVLDWSEAKHQDLSAMATVPQAAGALAGSNGGVGLRPGDRCSLRDLLYAALMQSDNQAALTLADHVGRALGAPEKPVEFFIAQMNALAGRQGMLRTRFLNPHGLEEERSLPYSTAEDMAKLTAYAMERSAFRFYVSQGERRISIAGATGETSGYMLKNTNELLGVDAIDGVKTGTTRRAGQCVIISAARTPESVEQNGTHIITPRRITVVVLGAADRFGAAHSLLTRGWSLYDQWAAAGRPKQWKPGTPRHS